MKSFIIALVACVSLSGCFFQRADSFDIHRAVAFCGSVENIAEITVHAIGHEGVTCMDQRNSILSAVKMNTK